jgi:hypothetical protein
MLTRREHGTRLATRIKGNGPRNFQGPLIVGCLAVNGKTYLGECW